MYLAFIVKIYFHYFVCVCVLYGVPQFQMRALYPVKMELQVIGSNLVWVLGINLGSLGRAVNSLNHWAVSPTLTYFSYIHVCMSVCVSVYMYLCVYMYVCIDVALRKGFIMEPRLLSHSMILLPQFSQDLESETCTTMTLSDLPRCLYF